MGEVKLSGFNGFGPGHPEVVTQDFTPKGRGRGTDIRTVQELLGHKDVATTQIYTHVMQQPGIGVKSPLDG